MPSLQSAVRCALILPLLACLLIGLCVTPAHTQDTDPLPFCGTPRLQPQARELARTLQWRPLTAEELQALQRADAKGAPIADVVGDRHEFWAYNFVTESYVQRWAECKKTTAHGAVYVQDGQSVTDATLNSIANAFENTIYTQVRATFGDEPNVDSDPHVVLYLLDIQDGYSPGGGYIAGYFDSRNEYSIQYSNVREMLYLDVNPAVPGSQQFLGTAAHEFQHMVHWNMDSGHDEETWVDEGCADLAQYLCGYGHPQSHLYTGSPSYPGFLDEPDHQLTQDGSVWYNEPHVLASYGAAYLWALYLWEHYGGNQIIQYLVDEEANGVAGVDAALQARGYSDRFAQAFRKWVVANYIDDGTGPYGYANIQFLASGPYDYVNTFPRPAPAASHGSYPVSGAAGSVEYAAADALRLNSLSSDLNLSFDGADGTPFAVQVIHSTTSNFDQGSNTVSEISLDGQGRGSVVVPSAGTQAVLLIPASLTTSGGGYVPYTYSASLGDPPETGHHIFLPYVMLSNASPTPTVEPPRAGHYVDEYGDDLYVAADRSHVSRFGIYVYVDPCGLYYIWRDGNDPINNRQFSWGGSFYASGTFNTTTSAYVVYGLNNFYISGCGYVSTSGDWSSTFAWQDYSTPPPLAEGKGAPIQQIPVPPPHVTPIPARVMQH